MSPDVTKQQEQQREAAQIAQKDASRINDRTEAVRNEVRNAQGALQASSANAERRASEVAHDVNQTCGRDAAALADKFRDTTQDVLNKTQEAAAAVFRLIDAALTQRADEQRVQTAALAASRVVEDLARDLESKSRELDRDVSKMLDEDRTEDVRGALKSATQDLEAKREAAIRDMAALAEQVQAARRDQERLDDLREAVEQERRRAERERQA